MQADLDNGYTRIANDILEVMSLHDLSGREFRVLIAIIRRTYGFQKKVDWIALSQFVEITGIAKENVSRILSGLHKKKIIVKEGDGYTKKIGINSNLKEWKGAKQIVGFDNGDAGIQQSIHKNKLSETTTPVVGNDNITNETNCRKRQPVLSDSTTGVVRNDNKGLLDSTTTKEKKEIITKESITKEKEIDFEKLWKSFDGRFGEKGAKQKAREEFKRLKPDNDLFETMLSAVFAQTRDKEFKHSQNVFHAPFQNVERWIKNRRWEDEITIQLDRPGLQPAPSRSERHDQSLENYLAELESQGDDSESMGDAPSAQVRYIASGKH